MEKITTFFNQLLQHLGFASNDFQVEVVEADQIITVSLSVPEAESGVLIGRGGDVLTSMQRLARVIFYSQTEKKIQLNINDYRQQRQQNLERLAEKLAQDSIQTKNPVMIHKPLSSYERFIIHDYIAKNFTELESFSQGEGDSRRLIIQPKTKSN